MINNDINVISTKTLESSDFHEAEKSDKDMVISPDIDTVSAKILETNDVHEVETTQNINFSCDMCEFVGESSNEIKIHMITPKLMGETLSAEKLTVGGRRGLKILLKCSRCLRMS